jgi:hypothetical protein
VEETITRRVQPYFVLEGNVCALPAAKDHVNLFLYDGAIVPDPDGIITGGHGNATARDDRLPARRPDPPGRADGDAPPDRPNNRAGGWRRLKGRSAGG